MAPLAIRFSSSVMAAFAFIIMFTFIATVGHLLPWFKLSLNIFIIKTGLLDNTLPEF